MDSPDGRIAALIEPLREAPAASAILCDIDGTLAPIVDDPERAGVPEETRELLRRLASRFALVACVSGRRAEAARKLVGVPELTYAGNHGLERLVPGASEPELDTAIADRAGAAAEFTRGLEQSELAGAGLRLEDKGPIQGLHWRGAPDEAAAERLAGRIAERAREAGLEPHRGRKVLEIRPDADIDKGSAVRSLLSHADGVDRAMFGGDDRTDLDAFAALRSLAADGTVRHAVCVGIDSAEAPEELASAADVVLGGTEDFAALLGELGRGRAEATEASRG